MWCVFGFVKRLQVFSCHLSLAQFGTTVSTLTVRADYGRAIPE